MKSLAINCKNRGITTLLATPDKAPAVCEQCVALAGDHNKENAAAASLVLRNLDLKEEEIDAGIESFVGLPHRLETVASIGSITFVNDSKATNCAAAAKAVAAFSNIYWLAGGLAKENNLDEITPHIANIEKAYLFGTSANHFADQLEEKCRTEIFQNLPEATHAAYKDAKDSTSGGTILLAPSSIF